MKIYIASSWKNQHGVEMLTTLLRERGHEVISWIENSYGEKLHEGYENIDKWIQSENGYKAFEFDTKGCTECDLLIYYSPAGQDACAELGAAWAKGIYTLGLGSKGEHLGLMRKMVNTWCERYTEVLYLVEQLQLFKNQQTA